MRSKGQITMKAGQDVLYVNIGLYDLFKGFQICTHFNDISAYLKNMHQSSVYLRFFQAMYLWNHFSEKIIADDENEEIEETKRSS